MLNEIREKERREKNQNTSSDLQCVRSLRRGDQDWLDGDFIGQWQF